MHVFPHHLGSSLVLINSVLCDPRLLVGELHSVNTLPAMDETSRSIMYAMVINCCAWSFVIPAPQKVATQTRTSSAQS